MTFEEAKKDLKRQLLDGMSVDVEDGTSIQRLDDGFVHQFNDMNGDDLGVLKVEELDDILSSLAQKIAETEEERQKIESYLNS